MRLVIALSETRTIALDLAAKAATQIVMKRLSSGASSNSSSKPLGNLTLRPRGLFCQVNNPDQAPLTDIVIQRRSRLPQKQRWALLGTDSEAHLLQHLARLLRAGGQQQAAQFPDRRLALPEQMRHLAEGVNRGLQLLVVPFPQRPLTRSLQQRFQIHSN